MVSYGCLRNPPPLSVDEAAVGKQKEDEGCRNDEAYQPAGGCQPRGVGRSGKEGTVRPPLGICKRARGQSEREADDKAQPANGIRAHSRGNERADGCKSEDEG